ncbi:cyclic nucleotide-gated ion channel 1-like [Mangifera indica]|uniref:cyclic nucleotide-gated ion channel 1-like n=1 Tax=Mangifera indica TaxID=29780 RepID=UPI001CF956F9|nr:cyclic nucleotide-gated ion channel 1-like [Mangifera indica]
MAIERETECWKNACRNHTECSNESFYCSGKLRDYTFPDGTCPTKKLNHTIYDFGIFPDALQSGVVEVTNFPQKFLHCFLRGLQNLRVKEMRLETLKIGDLMLLQKLPKNLQQQARKYQRFIWRKNKDDGVEFLFSHLPNTLARNINRELYLKLLKKVREFKMLNEERLEALCDNGITGFASTDHSRDDDNSISKKDDLVDCDFYGELIAWALDGHISTSIPLSRRSVKSLTNVEAFALMAYELKHGS